MSVSSISSSFSATLRPYTSQATRSSYQRANQGANANQIVAGGQGDQRDREKVGRSADSSAGVTAALSYNAAISGLPKGQPLAADAAAATYSPSGRTYSASGAAATGQPRGRVVDVRA